MSAAGFLARVTAPARSRDLARPLALIVALLFAGLYLANLDGWLMDDDEGTDFYEVWRLAEGDVPGVDYAAEQQPLFLLAGSAIVGAFGRSPAHLRLLSVIQVLAGASVLAWTVGRLYRPRVGLLTLALLLGNGLVYEQARLFRPDPNMFAWELLGLAAALWAWHSGRRLHWALAGAAYGVSMLWKPFALFPVAGLALLFAWWFWRTRADRRLAWPGIFASGVGFAVPFLLIAGAGSWLLYQRLGFYYGETFGYHAAMGAGDRWLRNIVGLNLPFALLFLFWDSLFYVWIWPFWLLNRKQPDLRRRYQPVLVAMLGVALLIPLLPRPILVRYFLFLIPILALIFAWQLDLTLSQLALARPPLRTMSPFLMALFAALAIFIGRRTLPTQLRASESGSRDLAAYVAAQTEADDVVVGDYAGINFLADRLSIYDASIIAQGQIRGGSITSERLVSQLEATGARIVLLHVDGGDPLPHHLVNLADYDAFRAYLAERYEMLTVFDRTGQLTEVYRRRESAP